MSSPVNVGDAIAIVTQIYRICEAYKSIPERLRQALKRFEDVKKECEALNEVLATSQGGNHQFYPGTHDLIQDLERAHAYFQRFEPLTSSDTGVAAKVKKTFSAKWRWSDVENHVATVNRHRENLRDFKQLVLIEAAQRNIMLSMRNIELQIGAQPTTSSRTRAKFDNDDASSFSSDHMSILSKASQSLDVARRLESERLHHHERLSPIIEASSASIRSVQVEASDDLKRKLADCIQKAQLHKPESMQVASLRDLQYIAELPEQWYRLQPVQGYKAQISESELSQPAQTRQYEKLPEPLRPISIPDGSESQRHGSYDLLPRFSFTLQQNHDTRSLDSDWNDIFERVGATRAPSVGSRQISNSDPRFEILSADSASVADSIPLHEEQHFTTGKVMIITPWISSPQMKQPLPCNLKIVKTDGSVHVQASTIQKFKSDLMPSLGVDRGRGLIQMIEADPRNTDKMQNVEPLSLVFTHAVLGGMRSFPKILHPSAEVPAAESKSYPYVIEFYKHQYVHVEGYSSLPKAVIGFAYLFELKKDRDLVRKEIFGKELLGSVGISTVQFHKAPKQLPKPCSTQAMSLWRNSLPGAFQRTSTLEVNKLTITIQCSTEGKRTSPDCALEFVVIKANTANVSQVRDEEGEELELELYPTFELQDLEDDHPTETAYGSLGSNNESGASCRSEYSVYSLAESSSSMHSHRGGSRRSSLVLPSLRRESASSTNGKKSIGSLRCWIKFTETSPSYIKAKKRLLNALLANSHHI